MDRLLVVVVGSGIGGGLRYLISLGMARWLGTAFPYGTLTVNVLGAFLIGLIMRVGLTTTLLSPTARLFLTTGVMGGLTTYSTFNYETLEFLRGGNVALGALNMALTGAACLLAGAAGLATGSLIASGSIVSG